MSTTQVTVSEFLNQINRNLITLNLKLLGIPQNNLIWLFSDYSGCHIKLPNYEYKDISQFIQLLREVKSGEKLLFNVSGNGWSDDTLNNIIDTIEQRHSVNQATKNDLIRLEYAKNRLK
jgi:hypothetical protein